MEINLPEHKPTWFDKTVVWGIRASYRISKTAIFFLCETKVVLKFSYPGNVQYHKIPPSDLPKFIECFRAAESNWSSR